MHVASVPRFCAKFSRGVACRILPQQCVRTGACFAAAQCGLGRGLGTGAARWENTPQSPGAASSNAASSAGLKAKAPQTFPAFLPPASHPRAELGP